MTSGYAHATCAMCGKHDYCGPLYGERGGPLTCLLCSGKWHGEHGRRRRVERVVIKAMKAYEADGGHIFGTDFDRLKLTASGFDGGADGHVDFNDLTSELLDAAIALTHPDKHPPERKAEANRVTQELLALKPFVFPAPPPPPPPKPDDACVNSTGVGLNKLSEPEYPCEDCRSATPSFYCDPCKAEYERREQEEFERRTAKQRAEYARRRQRVLATRRPATCTVCGAKFKSKRRDDARFCSDRCRQRAHRKAAVTGRNSLHRERLTIRDDWRHHILALLRRHRAVFLNDLLPESRTRAQYQALSLVAAKLESDGQIDTLSYLCRFGKPGFKALLKRGHAVEHPDKIYRLKDDERLSCAAPAGAAE
jgi:hypothetical protein